VNLGEALTRERSRRSRRSRRETELTFLRLLPGDSAVHRLWAGTKLLVAAELALMVSISPTWEMIGVTAGVVVLGLLVARLPLGAFPRLPTWFFVVFAISGLLSLWSATKPVADVGGISVSLGGLEEWARFTALAVVLLTSGALIGWTTPLGDVAPALSRLGRPLRWLRLPVDEWVVAIALAIRCLPLLIDEIRILGAARRLRTRDDADKTGESPRAVVRSVFVEIHDLMATAIVVSIRRARDLADAIEARGGLGAAGDLPGSPLRIADGLVLFATTAVCVVSLAVVHL
jgi:energy-coupling factor transporter transmembrane protein EcfT